jgi:hypothetical protein
VQHPQLGGAADEAREPAVGGDLKARAAGRGADELEDLHRRAEPLDRHGSDGSHAHVALDEPQRAGRQQDGAGLGDLLHSRREVRGLTDRAVVHVEVAANGAHDDLAGVQTHADLHRHSVRALQLVPVAPHLLLHPERGVAGALRVVVVGQGRAEERHDAVAHHLVHRALVVMDGLHHPLEDGIEELAGLLGITIREQLERASDVGEEDGDLLALAFEGAARGQDPGGEVGRSVRGRARGWTLLRIERAAAVFAEAAGGGVTVAAGRAGELEAGTAVAAELRGGEVRVPALRAGHRDRGGGD